MITFAHRRYFSRAGAHRRAILFGTRAVNLPLND
jgi:hypothetical protein